MSGRIPKVVVVGGTYVDIVIRCDQTPSPGQSVAGSRLSYAATGPGPNQAAEAALCGCQVHLISKVGGDPFAQMVKANLTEFDINTDFIYTAEAKNTGVVATLVNAEGENASLTYTGANSALQPQDINDAEQIISEADVCLIHGQLPQDTVVTAIRCAKVHGVKVILNPARPLTSAERVEAGMKHPDQHSNALPADYFSADILIPNLYEAADITDQSDANIHAAKLIGSDLVARGTDSVVITMGRRGCMVVDRNGADHIPAFEVELVDQTGRGDAFAGALAACCAVGDDLRKAVKFASAAGALTCTKFGSLEALPQKADIIELLQKQDVE
jgi:ribokinase